MEKSKRAMCPWVYDLLFVVEQLKTDGRPVVQWAGGRGGGGAAGAGDIRFFAERLRVRHDATVGRACRHLIVMAARPRFLRLTDSMRAGLMVSLM